MPKIKFQYVRHGPPETLLAFLTNRFKYHPQNIWYELIFNKQVVVNNQPTSPQHILKSTELIIYQRPYFPEPHVNKQFQIIYQDKDLLAVSKSNNIPTSPSGKYWHNSLIHVLQNELNAKNLRAIHRLDRETSGVNLFAFGKENAAILCRAFQQKQVRKTYAALLKGHIRQKRTQVDIPITADPHSQIHIKQAVCYNGKPSKTNFYLVRLVQENTLAHIRPLTGRTHQIRVHAAHIGHPVLHDKLYSQNENDFLQSLKPSSSPNSPKHQLHALRLQLQHPRTKRQITFQDTSATICNL